MNIYVILNLAIAFLILRAFYRGRRAVLSITAGLFALRGVSMYIGVNLNWARLIPAMLLVELTLRGSRSKLRNFPGWIWIACFFAYLLILSCYQQLFDPRFSFLVGVGRSIGWGPAQTDYRLVVQFVAYIVTFSLPILYFLVIRDRRDMISVAAGFIFGNVLSVGCGCYQVMAQKFGLPWIAGSIGQLAQGHLGLRDSVISVSLGGVSIPRLFGLGGEPKHTASLAVLALGIILASFIFSSPTLIGRPNRWRTAILLIGLLLTFSTSGWLALAIMCSLFFLLASRRRPRRLMRILFVGLVFLAIGLSLGGRGVARVFQQRVVGRMDSARDVETYEYKDGAFVSYASDHPFRTFWGLGPGAVDFFLIQRVRRDVLTPKTMLTPTYTCTRLLSDAGLPGLIFISLMLISWVRRIPSHESPERAFLVCAALTLLIMPFTTFPSFLALAGAFIGAKESGVAIFDSNVGRISDSRLVRPAPRSASPNSLIRGTLMFRRIHHSSSGGRFS